MLQTQVIDLRADATDRLATAPSQPEAGLAVFEPGIVLGAQVAAALQKERRDPVGIVGENRPRDPEEGLQVPFALYRFDRQAIGSHYAPGKGQRLRAGRRAPVC